MADNSDANNGKTNTPRESNDTAKVPVTSDQAPLQIRAEDRRKVPPQLPSQIAVLPLSSTVLFPNTVVSITLGKPRSMRLIEEVLENKSLMAIVTYKNPKDPEPGPDELYQVGCVAQVLRSVKTDEGHYKLIIQGLKKVTIDRWLEQTPYLRAEISVLPDIEPDEDNLEARAIHDNLAEGFKELVSKLAYMPDELAESVSQTREYCHLTYLISASIRMEVPVAQALLEEVDVLEKMKRLNELVSKEQEVLELGQKIMDETKQQMDKAQREYMLRQQIKAIQQELGEESSNQQKIKQYHEKIANGGLNNEARKTASAELQRLEQIPEASSEYGLILAYLDWLTELPWQQQTEDIFDLNHARQVLDKEHFGLEAVKLRLLEYLAVRQLRHDRSLDLNQVDGSPTDKLRNERDGVILCFAGAPGLGKTSLGRSIAHALGREFHRISLGGVRDEAEIRGHRRTYVGAMPGRFIKALSQVGTNNPVILLDELDKVVSSGQGDPAGALLEVLDPEQNQDFRDHYLDVPFDFSKIMFIATVNVLEAVPGPLLDRMEVIHLPGYTDEEKCNIAKNYLLPRQQQRNGLEPGEFTLADLALLDMIRNYTREAGVRQLERQLGAVCRKVAVKITEGKAFDQLVEQVQLAELLGKPKYQYDIAERTQQPGVAIGLAVTAAGGDILFIESTRMHGNKGLVITGQLGDVMKESVQASLSYVRTHADSLGIDEKFFDEIDLHVHIPAGAVPKDGPSAGVALITCITSLLTGRPVCKDVGMTGEISLRGKVLPVGGVKDKILAAQRAGLTRVILPKRNEGDLDDLPASVREQMTFILADEVDTVLAEALT